VRKSEYKYINDHHRFIKFHNMISSMTATQTFTVMYEIEVCLLPFWVLTVTNVIVLFLFLVIWYSGFLL